MFCERPTGAAHLLAYSLVACGPTALGKTGPSKRNQTLLPLHRQIGVGESSCTGIERTRSYWQSTRRLGDSRKSMPSRSVIRSACSLVMGHSSHGVYVQMRIVPSLLVVTNRWLPGKKSSLRMVSSTLNRPISSPVLASRNLSSWADEAVVMIRSSRSEYRTVVIQSVFVTRCSPVFRSMRSMDLREPP